MNRIQQGLPWRDAARKLLDTVFPLVCVECRTRGSWLCPACLGAIERLPLPLCAVCRQPVDEAAPHGCRSGATMLASVSAIGVYAGPLRAAVRALKYEGRHAVASALAPLLAERVAALFAADDLLVAVPLHPSRQRERGYNQSAIVAAELARLLPLELTSAALQRTRATAD